MLMAGQILQSQILGQMTFILELNQDAITLSIPGGLPVNDNQARAFPDQTIQMTLVAQFMTDHGLLQA